MHLVDTALGAAKPLLALLLSREGLDQWAVVRREAGHTAVIAATSGDGFPLVAGERLPWRQTLCARMVAGEGPRAAHDVATVPVYAEAPVTRRLGQRAYVGAPITCHGSVVGTLCGFGVQPRPPGGLASALVLLEACAELLGRLWEAESEARTDSLTGLMNRRGWRETLTREESRCRRHELEAAVVAVDLDDFKAVNDAVGHAAGDRYLNDAVAALTRTVREHEVVARWGGDEFVVLAIGASETEAVRAARRLEEALTAGGTPGSCGVGVRTRAGLDSATEGALEDVGRLKRAKRPRFPRGSACLR